MYSLLELAQKIEPDVARDPGSAPAPEGPALIGPSLRGEILSVIKSNTDYENLWKGGKVEGRHTALTLVLRLKPRLMLKVLESVEFHASIMNIAAAVVKQLEDKTHEKVDPQEVNHLARRLHDEPALLNRIMQTIDVPVPFPIVQALELEEIRKSRRERDPDDDLDRGAQDGEFEGTSTAAARTQLFGVCLSGGGIRSATFDLGVLQGLADLDLLRHVDYLSTVSGGGYIGGWLTAWIKHAGGLGGIHTVQTMLAPKKSPNPAGDEQAPIRFLQQYSNYLTPKRGFFTADTWTLVAEWVRNTLLNQLVLVLFLAGVLLLPHALIRFVFPTSIWWPEVLVIVSLLGFVVAIGSIALNMSSFDGEPARQKDSWLTGLRARITRPRWIQMGIVIPVMAAAFVFAMWHVPSVLGLSTSHLSDKILSRIVGEGQLHGRTAYFPFDKLAPGGNAGHQTGEDAGLVALVLLGTLLVVSFAGRFDRCFYDGEAGTTGWRRAGAWLGILATVVVASLAGGIMTLLFSRFWVLPDNSPTIAVTQHLIAAFVFGPPILVGIFALTMVLQIGLLGRNLPDERREWWSRLGAWAMIYSLTWAVVTGISLYGPTLVEQVAKAGKGWLAAGGLTWIGTTLFGVLSARSAETSAKQEHAGGKARWLNLVAMAAPYVFVIGLLLAISCGLHYAIHSPVTESNETSPASWASMTRMLDVSQSAWLPWLSAIGCLVLAVVLAWRVDVNEFSMHHFYKNRLVRCYLGASRIKERKANGFTGFDAEDEVRLATLRVDKDPKIERDVAYLGPYPIINVALNLVGGSNLAWQERKAESFVFTPQFCGYAYSPPDQNLTRRERRYTVQGYRPTDRYAYSNYGGIGLGTAMAISGAAANPNMGYHSSPAVSFLMTMFNVRLGWWLGNPRDPGAWSKSSPGFGLTYLLKELFGTTTDSSSFVNLSDGGHFENLGLYELVRRRCLYIIACDASQDPAPAFDGLGSAIRKCRTDMGVEIELPLERMRELAQSETAKAHGTVGVIRYPDGVMGRLLYIKTTLTHDESVDVLEYSIREPSFPNQSTADQWFDESQFESYRKLGHHSIDAMIHNVERRWPRQQGLKKLFEDLHGLWFPPTASVAKAGRKHSEAYDGLMERIREAGLTDLDALLFPDANILIQQEGNGSEASEHRPHRGIQRDVFYVVNSLIQLMETVFIDLNMDEEPNHPHTQGWIKIFRRWVKSPMLTAVWQDSSRSYSERFQAFCHYTLELHTPGMPKVERDVTDDVVVPGRR